MDTLEFNYYGDRIDDLMLYDYKENSAWTAPLNIKNLRINIKDAHPNIYMKSPHHIGYLEVTGTY